MSYSLSEKIKEILPKTDLLINGYIRLASLIMIIIHNVPELIKFLIKMYYQQSDRFCITQEYKLFNNNQTALRKWDHHGNNLIYARICGKNTIDYKAEMMHNLNLKFKWKIRIDECPKEWDVGIIDKSILMENNEIKTDVNFAGIYGIDEGGAATYMQNPSESWMYPIIGSWDDEITTGAIITIELNIIVSQISTGNVNILINDVDAWEFPWIYSEGKYGIYICMKQAEGKFSIIQYDCQIMQ